MAPAFAGGWSDDDCHHFLMSDHQSTRGDDQDETPTDAVVRAQFRLRLAAMHKDLHRHHVLGIQLRALFYACCNELSGNTVVWLQKYYDLEWPTKRRGPFPWHGLETWSLGSREAAERKCETLHPLLGCI